MLTHDAREAITDLVFCLLDVHIGSRVYRLTNELETAPEADRAKLIEEVQKGQQNLEHHAIKLTMDLVELANRQLCQSRPAVVGSEPEPPEVA